MLGPWTGAVPGPGLLARLAQESPGASMITYVPRALCLCGQAYPRAGRSCERAWLRSALCSDVVALQRGLLEQKAPACHRRRLHARGAVPVGPSRRSTARSVRSRTPRPACRHQPTVPPRGRAFTETASGGTVRWPGR